MHEFMSSLCFRQAHVTDSVRPPAQSANPNNIRAREICHMGINYLGSHLRSGHELSCGRFAAPGLPARQKVAMDFERNEAVV